MSRLVETMTASIVAASVVLSGCAASVKVARFDQVTRAPKVGDLDVFTSAQAVPRPYKEIALITTDEGWSDSITDLTLKMIAQARALGADAVILLSAGQKEGGGVLVGAVYAAANENTTRCTAIVYTDASESR
jgi:hypothetical protein